MTGIDRQVERVAAQQHGLVTRAQANESGLTSRQIRRRVESGAWTAIDHRVFRMGGAPDTWHSRVLARCMGTGGMASHETAAHLWRLGPGQEQQIHVIAPRSAHVLRDDTFLHQYSQFHWLRPVSLYGIPTTPATVTALDMCGVRDLAGSLEVIDTGRRLEIFDWPDLVATLRRHARRGRNGSGNLREILNRFFGELAIPDSSLNRNVALALEAAGVERPELEFWITLPGGRPVRMDLAWPHLKVAVEMQSAWHLNSETQSRDADKLVGAQRRGWTVLWFTADQWKRDPFQVVSAIVDALDQAAQQVCAQRVAS